MSTLAHLTSPDLVEPFARVPREGFVGPVERRVNPCEARLISPVGIFHSLA
jgi:hypothetical protein